MSNSAGRDAARVITPCAETQREAGATRQTADHGSVIFSPQVTGIQATRDANLTFNVNTYVQPPARTDETNAVSSKTKGNFKRCQDELKSYLQHLTQNVSPVTEGYGPTPLNKIYTKLYITEGGSGEVNSEHEVIELECKRCTSEERKIQLNNIFKPLSNKDSPPQRVLTKGIAGIGKTVAVQKFTHDWAAGDANQTPQFIFPFTFRDLNLIKDKSYSLVTLINDYFKEVKDLETSDYNNSSVLFIFDGLDESKFPLDFKNNEMCRSLTKATTVDVLLTNLITGKLLHKASVWITSRPAAAAKIPSKYIDRVTEVRGFNDEQKDEYFRNKVRDKDLAQKILDHLHSKPLRSLYIMCHIPVFCWISATALQSLLTENQRGELPKTVSEMYTHFLHIQTKLKDYQDGKTDRGVIMKLGKLAFEQLRQGNIIFYEDDLKSYEISLEQAAVYSGVCTEIIRKEYGLHIREVYSFIHLSVQEFLAALYVLETFIDRGENLLPSQTSVKVASERGELPLIPLHKNATDMALVSSSYGQWDLFLRFLLGLSKDSNQELLQKVFGFKGRRPLSSRETITYIHEKIKKLSYTDTSINLFHCLNELGDRSLVDQVQRYQSSGDVSKMSPAHWSALAFVLLVSNEALDVFDLKKYSGSDEVLERLLPVLKASKTALLSDCSLTDRCCKYISSVLGSESSGLEELDLSRNKLQDPGIALLSEGLKSPACKLQRLRLAGCRFTESGCAVLASSLKSNPAHLRVLDLARNKLQDAGVEHLSKFLAEPLCRLETLNLKCCTLTEACCQSLTSALSCSSDLKELDLRYNSLKDDGVKLLSDWLQKPQCGLEILRLSECTESSCESLASALRLNPSHLRELELSNSHPGDSALQLLSDLQKDKNYRLQTLIVT